jgi:hypothetical protein
LFKGPWKDQISAGDAVLLESELLSALKGDLRTECAKARDHVSTEHATLKSAEDAARNKLITEVTEKRNAEVARMAERQGVISKEVAACDAEIQTLQATVNQFDQQYRVQAAGFMQQQQMNAAQIAAAQRAHAADHRLHGAGSDQRVSKHNSGRPPSLRKSSSIRSRFSRSASR